MKRIISIPLILLILFTGININVASHYCCGHHSATKVSFSGKLASCGMEDQTGIKSDQDLISNHCCEDIISSWSISTNYVSSSCPCPPDSGQEISHSYIIQSSLIISQDIPVSAISGNKKPPGTFSPVDVEQQVICIFQI